MDARSHSVGDAVGDYTGLARPGPGNDGYRPGERSGRGTLILIEPLQQLLSVAHHRSLSRVSDTNHTVHMRDCRGRSLPTRTPAPGRAPYPSSGILVPCPPLRPRAH